MSQKPRRRDTMVRDWIFAFYDLRNVAKPDNQNQPAA
jgi:hypothetical protein